MKVKGCAILFFMFFSMISHGQDLIVTYKGDSLNVKIGTIERDKIWFSRRVDNQLERGFFYRDSLNYFERNFYKIPVVGKNNSFKRLRIGVTAGGGMQTGTYSMSRSEFPEKDEYMDKLQFGYTVGAEGCYYFTDIIGAGLRYNYFSAENKMQNLDMLYTEEKQDYKDTSYMIHGDLQDKIRINFIGPEFMLSIPSKSGKIRYNTSFAFGIMFYHNDFIRRNYSVIRGMNVGMNLAFCPEFIVSRNLAVGVEASVAMGSLTKYTEEYRYGSMEGKKNTVQLRARNAISMTRIDLTLSLKWIN
ncbi:MAG: hypothetical protein ACM3N9_01970 [Syntrophothermus sp.]